MFKSLIYLASPYSHKDPNVVTQRVLEVQDATARLIEQGHLIFSPIVHSHHLAELLPEDKANSLEFWLEFDTAMIDKADELWVLRLPGHTLSKGVHAELYHALEQGKKVKYINYPDLSTFAAVEAVEINSEGFPDVWDKEFQKDKFETTNTFGKAFPEGPSDQADGYAELRSTPTIISLTGHAQSGKDTAGKYLVENHGFIRIGLADAVKDCLYALDPLVNDRSEYVTQTIRVREWVDELGWEHCKTRSLFAEEFRGLLQKLGTEVGRNIISETIWLDIAKRKIDALGPDAKVVITDVRFPNEAEWVRSLGGQVVRINRPGFGPVNEHASDQRLSDDLVDFEVRNHWGIADLYAQLETTVLPYIPDYAAAA